MALFNIYTTPMNLTNSWWHPASFFPSFQHSSGNFDEIEDYTEIPSPNLGASDDEQIPHTLKKLPIPAHMP